MKKRLIIGLALTCVLLLGTVTAIGASSNIVVNLPNRAVVGTLNPGTYTGKYFAGAVIDDLFINGKYTFNNCSGFIVWNSADVNTKVVLNAQNAAKLAVIIDCDNIDNYFTAIGGGSNVQLDVTNARNVQLINMRGSLADSITILGDD